MDTIVIPYLNPQRQLLFGIGLWMTPPLDFKARIFFIYIWCGVICFSTSVNGEWLVMSDWTPCNCLGQSRNRTLQCLKTQHGGICEGSPEGTEGKVVIEQGNCSCSGLLVFVSTFLITTRYHFINYYCRILLIKNRVNLII